MRKLKYGLLLILTMILFSVPVLAAKTTYYLPSKVVYGENSQTSFETEEKRMNTKEEVLNDIAKEIYGKTYDDLRSVEQDEVYCIAEDSGWV